MGNQSPEYKSLAGAPEVTLLLRRSARAQRITLRISSLDGRVTLTVPRGVSEAEALVFASGHADWIRERLSRQARPVTVSPGLVLPVSGVPHEIVVAPSAGWGDGVLRVREGHPAGPQVAGCLKARARERLSEATERYAARLGRRVGRISLRDTRSRWGSCSSRGDLMFSWRLVLAPPEVLDYLAAHEVAHLVRMDHSRDFWAVVNDLMPDHARHRAWLRRYGAVLHAWRFD